MNVGITSNRHWLISFGLTQKLSNVKNNMNNYYTTVFAQCFSPCGKFLLAGNNYGKVAVFNVNVIINLDSIKLQNEDCKRPIYIFQAHDGAIYSMLSSEKFLITAGDGDILGWSWTDIYKKLARISWALNIPQGENLSKPETNALVFGQKDGHPLLFSGSGDNLIYMWDLETGAKISIFTGHDDYILSLAHCNNSSELVSGSEDGSVLFWDTRKPGKATTKIEPYKHECFRPKFGKWIGSVALDSSDEWMACGGGPALTLWHKRSLSPTITMSLIDSTINCCMFYDDLVISCGGEPHVHQCSYSGDLKAKIPTTSSSAYNVVIRDFLQNQMLTAAGNSSTIDVCTNFKYRDFTLQFK